MRKLIVIAHDLYVRNLIESGALSEVEDEDTFWVAGRLRDTSALEAKDRYLGRIDYPPSRDRQYMRMRDVMLVSRRRHSRTQQIKLRNRRLPARLALRVVAAPGLRDLVVRFYLWRTGRSQPLDELLERVRPDLVILPTGGTDPLVIDALRSCRGLGIRTLALIYNWDNLSSKGVFPVLPDHFGVVGEQSVRHAERIHRAPRESVTVLGSPYIDNYFRHEPASTARPFPFRFVLFAGCYMPFEEVSTLRRLEETIERRGLDLKVVYRPHPHRQPRARPDVFVEEEFRHVVLDPQVRSLYNESFRRAAAEMSSLPMPELDYYPALLEHSEFVICPLSTMVVESAVFERRVLVIAYHDGIHNTSPGVILEYDHFEGIRDIEGFAVCRDLERMPELFTALAQATGAPDPPLRPQIRPWLYFEEGSTYAERLAALVERLDPSGSLPAHVRVGPEDDAVEP